MQRSTGGGRTRLQRVVARGYDPLPSPAAPVTVVLSAAPGADAECVAIPEDEAADRIAALPSGGLGVLLPTYVSRCTAAEHAATFRHLLDALTGVREEHPDFPVTVWVGMQYSAGEYHEAVHRLHRLHRLVGAARGGTVSGCAGIALPGPGKIRTTNAAVRLGRSLGYAGWLWMDDDVELGPGCLERLLSRFRQRGCTGAVGAWSVALSRPTPAARTMAQVAEHTAPPRSYPTAACMIVQAQVIACGIPERRVTDDGFVLFELLDPAAVDPLHRLEVVPEAHCRFYRVARTHDTLRRLRRSMYSHVTCMADYPRAVAARYFTHLLFYGLWPLAAWDGSRGTVRGLLRWAVKAVQFCWCGAVVAALATRGVAGRPLRSVAWGDEGDFRTPAGGGGAPGKPSG